MAIFRTTLGVITGYAIFVISAVLLFQLSGIDPHTDVSWTVIGLTVVYGAVFSFLAGFIAHLISGTRTLTANYILACIMAAFAAFSLFKTSGNHYSQLAAIFLFAPASIGGGLMRQRRVKQKVGKQLF